jgi:hypothetical protein
MTDDKALEIAKQAVADNEAWADRAIYEVNSRRDEWWVGVTRIEGYGPDGEPRIACGGHRLIIIDANGIVTGYSRGR